MSRSILCFSVDDGSGAKTKIQQVDASNPLPVSASVTASAAALANAVAQSYGEGTTNPLSADLTGALRITGTINASSSMRSTTADPSYINGTDNALSSDLSGYLRSLCKQTGTWTVGLSAGSNLVGKVGIDQTTPGTTNAVDVTNWPITVDVNSGVKSNSTPRFVIATDQPQLTNALKVDGSAVTQPISITPSATSQLTEAKIDFNASGDTALVAAAAAKTTKVHRVFLVAAGATTITWKDGATALTGAITLAAGGSFVLDMDSQPWFTGTANTALNLNSSAAVQVSGRLYYVNS